MLTVVTAFEKRFQRLAAGHSDALLPFWERAILTDVRVFNRATVRRYAEEHADVREQLQAWFHEAESASWTCPSDIKARYRSADFVGKDRIVFNIKGNHYRLVAMVNYGGKAVFIRFIGTHHEYDQIDAATV